MTRRAIPMLGKRCGRLVVVEPAVSVGEKARWRCQCDCGNTVIVSGVYLRKGTTKSCGCLREEVKHLSNKERAERPGNRMRHKTWTRLEDYFDPPPREIDRSAKTWETAESAMAELVRVLG